MATCEPEGWRNEYFVAIACLIISKVQQKVDDSSDSDHQTKLNLLFEFNLLNQFGCVNVDLGTFVCRFTLCTNEGTNRRGEKRKRVKWVIGIELLTHRREGDNPFAAKKFFNRC